MRNFKEYGILLTGHYLNLVILESEAKLTRKQTKRKWNLPASRHYYGRTINAKQRTGIWYATYFNLRLTIVQQRLPVLFNDVGETVRHASEKTSIQGKL